MQHEQQKWRAVKAAIVMRYGTIRDAAAALGVSPEAMRLAVMGKKCPGVRKKLIATRLLIAAA